jgi:hypothetical protein
MVVYFYQVDSAAIIQKMWPRYVPVDIDLCLCASCVNSLELCTVQSCVYCVRLYVHSIELCVQCKAVCTV